MNDSCLPVATESAPPAGKRPGVVESVLQKLFTRQSRVDSIEELNPKFRLITLSGDALKKVTWVPGDKVQVQLGGWVQRTYTPLDWVSEEGRARILVYLHTDGPGTRWARSLRVGDACTIFGPRKSIDLTQLRRPAIFFGDETSFGLAWALKGAKEHVEGIEFLFELSTPSESLAAIRYLGLSNTHHRFRGDSETYLSELEAQMRALLAAHRPVQVVLTGRSVSVQRLHRLLRLEGFSSWKIHARAYWIPGKTG